MLNRLGEADKVPALHRYMRCRRCSSDPLVRLKFGRGDPGLVAKAAAPRAGSRNRNEEPTLYLLVDSLPLGT